MKNFEAIFIIAQNFVVYKFLRIKRWRRKKTPTSVTLFITIVSVGATKDRAELESRRRGHATVLP